MSELQMENLTKTENQTEALQEKPEPKEKTPLLIKIYIHLLLFINILCICLYISGLAAYYGKPVDISMAVSMIFETLEMIGMLLDDGKLLYYNAMSSCLGIMYIVILIMLIKSLVTSFIHIKKIYDKKIDIEHGVFVLASNVSGGVFRILLFLLACGWVWPFTWSANAKAVMWIGAVTIISARAVVFYLNKYTLKNLIIHFLYITVFLTAIALVIIQSNAPIIADFVVEIKSVGSIFWGTATTVECMSAIYGLFKPAVYAIISIQALKCLCNVNDYLKYWEEKVRKPGKKAIVATVVLCFVSFAFYVIEVGNNDIATDEVYQILYSIYVASGNHIPLLLATIAMCVAAYFPAKCEEAKAE